MANKNLIKRAFSVTAGLPPAHAAAGSTPSAEIAVAAPITETPSVQQNPGSEVLPSPVEGGGAPTRDVPAGAKPLTPPRTGPGSMLAFMAQESVVHKEVLQLRERVAAFDGAEIARRLDPTTIAASRWANREEAHFATDAFAKLKDEIATAGGNVQPIKVRPIADRPTGDAAPVFEIVYGHRRHRACLELGIPVLALVQQVMEDVDLFVEMERENRNREDLSAWEQGVMYMRALEQGLFPSAKQLGIAIDRDMSNISRAMALAKLPAEVVRAFGSPLNLQFRWATLLKDAHQRDPEGLLSMARDIASRQPRPAPAEVFAILTGSTTRKANGGTSQEWTDAAGKPLASLTVDKRGRVTVVFDQVLDDAQRRRLSKMLDTFVGSKT
ncbi:ParB/RepB/Spo0J family partition protein [Variovorax ginsengisoli]|uniref:ParB family chromosome partitioning protein n=1 Tax=Variovorax ginsengisoli TaxID=363844 RepID=A0ABT9S910_9BURK|nr:ParB/RepB/Spo0J family partition protein [Variovorax ginsengisoli]MDP9900836.1 ParB family chromosome partitioning protein [Variovorax ginsengisoli]